MSGPFELQFLRPAWLLAFLLLPLLVLGWRRHARRRSAWSAAVDPHLLAHLLGSGSGRRGSTLAAGAVLSGLALAIVAAAGPSWRAVPQPLQGDGGALVIALDLSSATLTADLPPSRLAQARSRLDALLQAHAGEVGLVAYADDAFVVSPVTPDPANVAVFLDALAPDIMPVDGHRPERAIALAAELLQQSGHARGDILLMAPEAGQGAVRAAARAAASGYRVSALAMGTVAGAGYRGRDGEIHRSALDPASLQALVAAGGGRLHAWDAPPAEIVAGGGGSDGDAVRSAAATSRGLVPEDGGYWLLPLALLLLLSAFRRGTLLAVVAVCVMLPLQPAVAADAPEAGAWRRADQAAHARSVAAEAAYRAGDYAAAARDWATLPGADAAYNRGNALARAGRYEEAIAAYDQALEAAPGMPDAQANRAAVEAAMRRSPPPPGGEGPGEPPPQGGEAGNDAGNRGDAGRAARDGPSGNGRGGEDPSGEDAPTPPGEPDDAADAATPPTADAGTDREAAARQQAADQAQREAMQRALEAADNAVGGPGESADGETAAASTRDSERAQANAAWLRRVPDDPGALLRARFSNEHLRRRSEER